MRVTRSLDIPEEEIVFRFSRSSGPGGQNVNRRATKAELVFDLAGSSSLDERQRSRAIRALGPRLDAAGRLHVVSQAGRTQSENRSRALERFRGLLEKALAPPPPTRRATKPSRASVERRLQSKRRRASVKRKRERPPAED